MRRHLRTRSDPGFTLVEILVAIVLVGILSAVVVVGVGSLTDKGTAAACAQSADAARTASVTYLASNGGYPTTFDQLRSASLLQLPSNSTVDGTSTLVSGNGWTMRLGGAGTSAAAPTFTCGTSSTSYLAAVIADSPAAYWRFDRMTTPMPLTAGSGASLSLTSAAAGSPFSDAPVAMPSSVIPLTAPSSVTSGLVTVEFWMYPTSTNIIPISFGQGISGTPSLWQRPEGFGFNMGNGDIWGTDPLPLNTWSHVVATFPNGPRANARLFINGVEKALSQRYGTTSTTYPNLVTSAYLGAFGPSAFIFNGALAELAMYPASTDPASVAAHATITNSATYRNAVTSANPTAYWRLAGPAETVVATGGASLTLPMAGQSSPFANANVGLSTGVFPLTAPAFVTSGAFTVEFWMKPTATNAIPISFGSGNNGTTSIWLRPEGFGFNTGNGEIWGAAPPALNVWTHVVAKFPVLGTTSGGRLFLNGVEQSLSLRYGPGASPSAYASRTAYLGAFGQSWYPFAGAIAELAFYPSTTDPATIAKHASITNP